MEKKNRIDNRLSVGATPILILGCLCALSELEMNKVWAYHFPYDKLLRSYGTQEIVDKIERGLQRFVIKQWESTITF